MIEFVIYGKPRGKQRPRMGKGHAYTPKETVEYEKLVKQSFLEQCGTKRFPDDAAIMIEITAYFSIPRTYSKTKKKLCVDGLQFPLRKPDFDNIAKIIADSLNGLAYKDVSAIVYGRINKAYTSDRERVEVKIWSIGGEEIAK
jgi:Holliday junction resolvase RusA-like endonuclease